MTTPGRRAVVVFALVASVLVVTAVPVQAAGDPNLEIASEHTTDTDFNAATTLSNVSVDGSGASASVTLDHSASVSYAVIDDSGDGQYDVFRNFIGDRGGDVAITYSAEVKTVPNKSGTINSLSFYLGDVSGSDYGFTVDIYAVKEGPDGTFKEGKLVRSNWNPDFVAGLRTLTLNSSFTVNAGETWTIEFVTSGNNGDSSSDNLAIRVDKSFTSTWYHTTVDGNQSVGANLTLSGTQAAATGTYISGNHSADKVEAGYVNLTLQNATADVAWQYWTGSSWTTQASSTFSTSGNKTLSWTPQSTSKWRVNVTFTRTSGLTTAAVNAEGVLFNASQPTLDNSTMSPSGGEQLDSQTVTLNVSVADADFPTAQGDSVTVTYYHKGPNESSYSQLGTDTLTSNGTASLQATFTMGGTHDWYVVASDAYGESVTSTTESFQVPSTLFIRNVTNASELVTDATVTVTFFDSGTVITRTTNDGTVNLTGTPVGGGFVALAEANGYYSRRIIIRSIYTQQSIYLLNNTVTAVEVAFQLDDATGRFTGPNTTIAIQRPINQSGSTEWQTVISDYIGANNEVPTILEQDQRYRIIVRNQGEARILGSYTATSAADPEVLPIGQVSLEANVTGQLAVGGLVRNVSGVRVLRFSYIDGADATSELTYRIVRASNTSHVVLANQTITDPRQRVTVTHNLTKLDPDANASTGYKIQWWADRTGQPDRSGSVTVGGALPVVCLNLPMDPQVLHLIGYVTILASGGLAVYSPRLASMGMASTAAGIATLGCAPIPGPVVGVMIGIAVLHNVGGRLR